MTQRHHHLAILGGDNKLSVCLSVTSRDLPEQPAFLPVEQNSASATCPGNTSISVLTQVGQ